MKQINILTVVALVSILGLTACDSRAVTTSVVPTPISVIPTATPQPIPTRTPTATPSPPPTTMPVTPLPFSGAPELVWLRYSYGTSSEFPYVLSVRNGIPAYELSPVHIARFWDYSRWSGRLAFSAQWTTEGTQQWGRAVSDLWVYDYTTGEAAMWLPDLVGSAAWSPLPDPETGTEYLAVAVLNPYYCGCSNLCYDLEIFSARDQIVRTIRRASPHFAWSPDGRWLAFFGDLCGDKEGEGIYIASVMEGEPVKIASTWCCGSIDERPIWAQEHGAIFYLRNGVSVTSVDGSWSFSITTTNSHPVDVAMPCTMLWSSQRRTLILASERGMETPPQVVAYALSEDLHTVVDTYIIGENTTLVGWLVPDETIILTHHGQIVIWSLENRAPVASTS